jgi:outer membrane protein TolC
MGRDQAIRTPLADRLPSTLPVIPVDMDKAVNTRPEVLLARETLRSSQANERLQLALAKPDPELLFGYKRTAGIDTVMGGFQLNLPLRNKNQGGISAAYAESRAAAANVTEAERLVRSEVETAAAELDSKRRLVTEVLLPMRDRSNEVARISAAAYLEGGFDLLRVLDAERVRIEALVAYNRALTEFQQSLVALQIAMGELP